MKPFRLVCTAVLAAAILTAVSPASAAPGAIAGAGGVTPPGCSENALTMSIVAANDGGDIWVAVRPASVAVYCPAIVYGLTMMFAGEWDPDEDVCLRGVSHPGRSLCIGGLSRWPVPQTSSLMLCFPTTPETCWTGSGTFVRAT